MHPNSLKNLKPFPKGTSGYPGGPRRQIPEELKPIKSLNGFEVNKLISKYARMLLTTLKEALDNPNTPVIELSIAKIFLQSIENGDYVRLNFLLDRCIGKVPVAIEDEEDIDAREEISKLSMSELLTLVKTNLPDTKT